MFYPRNFLNIVFYFITLLSLYLSFDIIWGKKGLLFYFDAKKSLDHKVMSIQDIKVKKIKEENKISLLKKQSLSRDFLEEQARKVLDLSRADEVIVINSK